MHDASAMEAKRYAELVLAAGDVCADALARFTDRDWRTVPARDLEWSVWRTVVHMNDDLYFYAAQIVLADPEDYICFELTADDHSDPRRLVAAMRVNARLLATTVAAADPAARGHHVYGVADPVGFAAMGVVECLIHTYDAIGGLDAGDAWRPPSHLAAPVIDRLFPHAPADRDDDAADVLLHLCGRLALGDRPRLSEWRWYSAPPG